MPYMLNLGIALDQLANAVLAGDPDETMSSRAWRAEQKGQRYWGWTRRAIDLLFFWQAGHCKNAYIKEFDRKNYPDEYRDGVPVFKRRGGNPA